MVSVDALGQGLVFEDPGREVQSPVEPGDGVGPGVGAAGGEDACGLLDDLLTDVGVGPGPAVRSSWSSMASPSGVRLCDGCWMAWGPWVCEEAGGVEAVGEGEVGGVEVGGGEVPEGGLGGLPAGRVGVGGDGDVVAAVGEAEVAAEELDLVDGQGGAHGGEADGGAVAAEGDGEASSGSFDEDGQGAAR